MTKPRSPSDQARAERRQEQAEAPPPEAPPRRFPLAKVAVAVGLLAVGAFAVYHFTRAEAPPEPPSAELLLGRRFKELKNAKDEAANDLLGPAPVVPKEPITPEETERLEAEFFLRDNYRVVDVRQESPGRVVLVLEGGVSSPRIATVTPKGVEVSSRVMTNPDVIVEVVDEKIRGVRARVQSDPDEKPVSPENARKVRRMLGVE
jgi:hypothetical protein